MTGVWAVIAHRAVTFALATIALAACGDDGPATTPSPTLVAVETQRCRQPNRFHGVGVVVGDDLVLTAGHTVEGDLRDLTVDSTPARVVTIDRRTDLALVSVDVPVANPPEPARAVPDEAQLLGPDGSRMVDIDRRVELVVDHATDRATYRRDVVFFTPGVADGDSGSPLVDDDGRLVGVVVAGQGSEGIAVTSDEVDAVLATAPDDLTWPDPPGRC